MPPDIYQVATVVCQNIGLAVAGSAGAVPPPVCGGVRVVRVRTCASLLFSRSLEETLQWRWLPWLAQTSQILMSTKSSITCSLAGT